VSFYDAQKCISNQLIEHTERRNPRTDCCVCIECFSINRIFSGDNFHVNEEQSLVDRKEIENVFQDRLSEMESKMNDLHDIINALTARIYTENDNRSLGDVLGYVLSAEIRITQIFQ
jgi:hypothetical protein